MISKHNDYAIPDFEIDHRPEYEQYFLENRQEVIYYLKQLVKRTKLITAYVDDGKRFFLSSLLNVDEDTGTIFLDPPQDEAFNSLVTIAKTLTIVASLDKVKIQFRSFTLRESAFNGQRSISTAIPDCLLRLQRREYFRLEPPASHPILCRLSLKDTEGETKTAEWGVADISAGGVGLIAPTNQLANCQRDTLYQSCRLEIPEEGVLLVNLRVRKTVEFSTESGRHHLQVGCEFINIPSSRLAMVERYITRIERQRTAKNSGLAD